MHRERRLLVAAVPRGLCQFASGVRVSPGDGEKCPVDCACACDGHNSRVGGRGRAFKLVSGAESQCWECDMD